MLKKIFLILGLILSPSIFSSEYTQCDFNEELGKGNNELISSYREKAFDTCLKCEGNSCKINAFTPKSPNDNICKHLFCKPIKKRKIQGEEIPTDLTTGFSKFEFSYKITEKGRISDVEIISLEGVMNQREAYRWTKTVTKRIVYLPLEIKGKTYEITNLKSNLEANPGPFDGG